MGHPKELIDKIVDLLEAEYPTSCGYRYVLEKRLQAKELGRVAMLPDIAIEHGGVTVCVVEIGYTRPEKLTAYRDKLRIPDVRWYGKDGTLHADVHEKVVSLSVSAEPAGSLFSYAVWGMAACVDCPDVGRFRRVPKRCVDRYIRRFGAAAHLERLEKVLEEEAYDVFTRVLTDYVAVWLPSECDKCGNTWMADDDLLVEACREGPRDVGRVLGAKGERLSWAEAHAVVDGYGLSLVYMDGHFLRDEDRARVHMAARRMAPEPQP